MSFSQAAPGVVGPSAGLDVPWLLRMRAESRRNYPFLIWAAFDAPARSWSYGEFHERVGALAAGLVKRGIKPGEYVLIHLDNWIEAVLAWFACVELGAIAVTTNTRSAAAEMEYFAGHCGAVAAITQPAYAELISANCRRLRWIAVISHDAGNTPAQGAPRGDRPCRAIDPSALCSVQYTSGTTSRPKAVLWTHANALWGAKINAAQEDPMPDEVPVVFIIPHAGVDSAPADLHDTVMATCRTSLADFKVPREIHFVDDMPRSTLEKVAKAELRKMLG